MSKTKSPQVLVIEPQSELKFKGPFNDVVTSYLTLRNPSDRKVCFKVKTTAPRRYCVRPNSGLVDPSGTVNVSVMLQPLDGDSNQDRGKHKFMVQSMYAPETVDDVDKLWSEAKSSDLMDSKLRCVFEDPAPTPIPEETVEPVTKQEQESVAAVATETKSAPAAAAVTAPIKDELSSIMEECKRLTSDNSRLKQLYDEAKSKIKPDSISGDALMQLKHQYTMYIVFSFIVGILLGYILA